MSTVYNNFKRALLAGEVDLDTDTVRVALISDDTPYTPDPDTEQFVSDVFDGGTTATEFTGTGYSRQTVANPAVTQDNTDDEGVYDGDDVVFSGIDGDTIQDALIYIQVGVDDTTPGDDVLIAHVTSTNFPLTANGGDVTVQWDAEGILNAQ